MTSAPRLGKSHNKMTTNRKLVWPATRWMTSVVPSTTTIVDNSINVNGEREIRRRVRTGQGEWTEQGRKSLAIRLVPLRGKEKALVLIKMNTVTRDQVNESYRRLIIIPNCPNFLIKLSFKKMLQEFFYDGGGGKSVDKSIATRTSISHLSK